MPTSQVSQEWQVFCDVRLGVNSPAGSSVVVGSAAGGVVATGLLGLSAISLSNTSPGKRKHTSFKLSYAMRPCAHY